MFYEYVNQHIAYVLFNFSEEKNKINGEESYVKN